MKAICYADLGNVLVARVKDPKILQSDDIIMRVTAASISGLDLQRTHGMVSDLKKGSVLGHETVGVVEETGSGVTHIQKGDRVIVPFPIVYDRGTETALSEHTGNILDESYYGGQAEFLRVPHADFNAVTVPDTLDNEQALLLTSVLPVSLRSLENVKAESNDTVVVLGCGPVGLTSIKWALLLADRVIAVDSVEYRLARAKQYGAKTVNIQTFENPGEYIKELTHGGADAIVDCVGMTKGTETDTQNKSAIGIAAHAVKKGGTVSLTGIYNKPFHDFPLDCFFQNSVTLKMGVCSSRRYIKPITKILASEKLNASDIITHRMPLKHGASAYKLFDEKLDNCIKVVLKP